MVTLVSVLAFLAALWGFASALIREPGHTMRCASVALGLVVGVPASIIAGFFWYRITYYAPLLTADQEWLVSVIYWIAGVCNAMVWLPVALKK